MAPLFQAQLQDPKHVRFVVRDENGGGHWRGQEWSQKSGIQKLAAGSGARMRNVRSSVAAPFP